MPHAESIETAAGPELETTPKLATDPALRSLIEPAPDFTLDSEPRPAFEPERAPVPALEITSRPEPFSPPAAEPAPGKTVERSPAALPLPSPPPVEALSDAEQQAALLAYVDSILLGTPPPRAPRRRPPFVAAPHLEEQPAEEEPTFQITIGHLEVIAPPPLKLPRQRRPAPHLSLQDYLDKRRVGRG